ncbi:F-box/kelch-repeat protein At1g57790-like isoform X2 [Rutidosis leptorrhynchoides]
MQNCCSSVCLPRMPPLSPNYPWLKGDNGEAKCTLYPKKEKDRDDKIVLRLRVGDEDELISGTMNESQVPYIPFDILETIMKSCVGVEYMHFRATCKRCHLAAPLIQFSKEPGLRRLHHKYSVISPWLMVLDKDRNVITFIDPVFGDRYFMRNFYVSWVNDIIYSRFGWLLVYSNVLIPRLIFFNPFTDEIHEVPRAPDNLINLCFSAPPTSYDCMVVGFTTLLECFVYGEYPGRERRWRQIRLDFGGENPSSFCYPTFCDNVVYYLRNDGELYVFEDLWIERYSWKQVGAKVPSSSSNRASFFLVKCDVRLLLVIVDVDGESVEVFKLINDDDDDSVKKRWEKIESLGRYMIYISDSTCLCIEAKIHEMENKIFFSRLHSKKRNNIVFYSLDTCKYHTFNGKNIQEPFDNFFGTTQFLFPHTWIEPCWS